MSAMTRFIGLSKAKLIGKSNFEAMGDIKRSSSAMNKAGLKRNLVSTDDDMFMAMQLTHCLVGLTKFDVRSLKHLFQRHLLVSCQKI